MIYALLANQRSMALDEVRNQAYRHALTQVIGPESVVLDLGAGLGVHGMMAAQLGAQRVYLVEPEDIIGITAEIVQANGLADRVQCIQGRIEQTSLPESVDVLISVFTGNFLLEEDLLPILFAARDRYLKPGGVMLPAAAQMVAVPVSAPKLHHDVAVWSTLHQGLDLSPARSYAAQLVHYFHKELPTTQHLADPATLFALDLTTAQDTHCDVTHTYTITQDGLCHGWCGWFDFRLGESWYSTAPHAPLMHWSAAFLPLDPPLPVTQGETAHFRLIRPPNGCWTWEVQIGKQHQQHSTLLGMPLTGRTLQRLALDYRPQLNAQRKQLQFVLTHCDSGWTVQQIAVGLQQNFPEHFPLEPQAVHYVQSLIQQYG